MNKDIRIERIYVNGERIDEEIGKALDEVFEGKRAPTGTELLAWILTDGGKRKMMK
mgnify:CR=1 FL=1|jgi:hypothetical protein|tara:strand:- start:110 stop:277 length:168 start_codon:yes stop_codon:yes gene_type:complete